MSTPTYGPTVRLSGPVPSPPRYNLLSVATIIPDPDLHFLAGAQIWPYPNAESGGVYDPCSAGTNRDKADQQDLQFPTFASYTVYETIQCTARAISEDYDEWAGRARMALQAVESHLVEEEFSRGLRMPLNPHLTDADVDLIDGGTAHDAATAIAAIEQSAARTGAAHILHVDPATAVIATARLAFEREGSELHVVGTGTRVVVGTGYVDAHAGGGAVPSETTSWAFATGAVEVRRSEIVITPGSVREAMDRGQNDITVRAGRDYLVYWEKLLQDAVLVNRAA